MKRWRRWKIRNIGISIVVFFMCVSFFHVLITPIPSDVSNERVRFQQYLLRIEQEKGEDFLKDKLLLQPHQTDDRSKEEEEPKINIQGAKTLPARFRYLPNNKKRLYKFLLQPQRVFGASGLLKMRESQGHTFGGDLMKGAIVILVSSEVERLPYRLLLRKTWASIREISGVKIETIFVVGSARNEKEENKLKSESQIYKDLLQYKGADGPSAAIDKQLAALQWSSQHLPGDFVHLTTRDDVIINIEALTDHLMGLMPAIKPPARIIVTRKRDGSVVVSSQPQDIICFSGFFPDAEVSRDPLKSHRAVDHDLYDVNKWPPFCDGALYAMPVTMVTDLYGISNAVNARLPPTLHDIYITGVLRRMLHRGDDNVVMAAKIPVSDWLIDFSRQHGNLTSDPVVVAAVKSWQSWYERLKLRPHIYTDFN